MPTRVYKNSFYQSLFKVVQGKCHKKPYNPALFKKKKTLDTQDTQGAFTRSGINHLLPVINVVGNSVGYNLTVRTIVENNQIKHTWLTRISYDLLPKPNRDKCDHKVVREIVVTCEHSLVSLSDICYSRKSMWKFQCLFAECEQYAISQTSMLGLYHGKISSNAPALPYSSDAG